MPITAEVDNRKGFAIPEDHQNQCYMVLEGIIYPYYVLFQFYALL